MFRTLNAVILLLVMAMAFSAAIAQYTPEEIEELRVKAEQGVAGAQRDLGVAYYSGDGIEKDLREAARWTRKAAEQGDADAQYNLGVIYSNGWGVEKDFREAARWTRKAAEQGLAEAQYNLGVAYEHGTGIEKNLREAVRWYRKAAKQGDPPAQYNLGVAYSFGNGVKKDPHEAARWYRKAAEQGNADAQYSLGVIYESGEGVEKSSREAVRWYRKSAEQGNASAQSNLGVAYDYGSGVEKNSREAVRWYRKAAKQGDAIAQYNLGLSYYHGQGVVTDDNETYIWLSMAKANGYEAASKVFSEINWRSLLSQGEIRSAQKEATRRLRAIDNRKEWFKKDTDFSANIATALIPKETSVAERVFENAWRSVVVVFNGDSQGSGVIIRPNIVATNCHVVDEVSSITVYKPANRRVDTETAFTATIRDSDRDRDFCLLDVEGLWGIPATVRRYSTLKVGEDVYGLGAPQGLDLSLSDGLVSQLRKRGGQRIIQTNAAISPGSSGGGLFDREGNLVGIMTSKITDKETEGIGFAIPADLVLEF